MNCEDIARLINSYADKELPLEIYSSVKKHISSCGMCQQELSEIIKIKKILRNSYYQYPHKTRLIHEIFRKLEQSSC